MRSSAAASLSPRRKSVMNSPEAYCSTSASDSRVTGPLRSRAAAVIEGRRTAQVSGSINALRAP